MYLYSYVYRYIESKNSLYKIQVILQITLITLIYF
jgi:hypothetical protein